MNLPIKEYFEKAKGFLKEVHMEAKKVSWPSRVQLTASTTVVFICIIIIAIFLGSVDYLFALLFRFIGR